MVPRRSLWRADRGAWGWSHGAKDGGAAEVDEEGPRRWVDRAAAPPGAAGAAVGDVLPSGRAGGGPAGPVRPDELGPDASGAVVGAARPGGARRPGRRPGPRGVADRVPSGGAGVP